MQVLPAAMQPRTGGPHTRPARPSCPSTRFTPPRPGLHWPTGPGPLRPTHGRSAATLPEEPASCRACSPAGSVPQTPLSLRRAPCWPVSVIAHSTTGTGVMNRTPYDRRGTLCAPPDCGKHA